MSVSFCSLSLPVRCVCVYIVVVCVVVVVTVLYAEMFKKIDVCACFYVPKGREGKPESYETRPSGFPTSLLKRKKKKNK